MLGQAKEPKTIVFWTVEREKQGAPDLDHTVHTLQNNSIEIKSEMMTLDDYKAWLKKIKGKNCYVKLPNRKLLEAIARAHYWLPKPKRNPDEPTLVGATIVKLYTKTAGIDKLSDERIITLLLNNGFEVEVWGGIDPLETNAPGTLQIVKADNSDTSDHHVWIINPDALEKKEEQ